VEKSLSQQRKEFHYVIVIAGHGDMLRNKEITSLSEAREIANILGGTVGIRDGRWRKYEPTA
jgi:hypothetical protein